MSIEQAHAYGMVTPGTDDPVAGGDDAITLNASVTAAALALIAGNAANAQATADAAQAATDAWAASPVPPPTADAIAATIADPTGVAYAAVVDAAGDVYDPATAALLTDPSASRDAADARIGAVVRGSNGKKYRLVSCVLRWVDATLRWQPINDAGHTPVGVASVATTATDIVITYDFVATKVGSLVVVPDETMIQGGYTAGPSVGTTTTNIRLSRGHVSDYVFWNGVTWASLSGIFTGFSFNATTGVLTLTHDYVGGAIGHATVRDGAVDVQLGSLTNTTTEIVFKDTPKTINDYITWNGTVWTSATGATTAAFNGTTGLLTLTHASVGGFGGTVAPRDGALSAQLDGLGATTTSLYFKDAAGVKQTTPATTMRAYVTRSQAGGTPVLTPSPVLRAYVSRIAGGSINPQTPGAIATGPSANLWVLGVMEV